MRRYAYAHFHWDREWYFTFQEYRFYLLKALDAILDLLESGKLRSFVLDGQACVVEDYLEVRPEAKERIEKLVKAGKLKVGPWYVQPDEFLVSGESLVRNLLLGKEISKKLGGCMEIGYLPDTFGHVAQLPQLLRGFGIRYFLFSRGMGDEGEELGDAFIWRSPDGSKVLAVHMRRGYCAGLRLVASATVYRDAFNGFCELFGKSFSYAAYHVESKPSLEEARKRLEELCEELERYAKAEVLLIPCGCDHVPLGEASAEVLDKLSEEGKLALASLEEFFEELEKAAEELEAYEGELRGSRYRPVLAGVLSTRAYLKQANFKCERLLTLYAEPTSVMRELKGGRYPRRLLKLAWKQLLKNQFHDSIYGSGVDEVHLENEKRFNDVVSLLKHLVLDNLVALAEVEASAGGGFLAYNPNPWSAKAVVRGSLVELPPMGFVSLEKLPKPSGDAKASGRAAENEHLRVVAGGGSLSLLDKRSGRKLEPLLYLVDEGDRGDEYNFETAEERPTFSSLELSSRVEVLERGPSKASLVVNFRMSLPERLASEKLVEVPVIVCASLTSGLPRLDLRIEVENYAEDHRLRVAIPLDFEAKEVYAFTPFYAAKRPLEEPKGESWVEKPSRTKPMQGWVAVLGGGRGLLVASRGTYEYEVARGERSVLYLTLFRSIGFLSKGDLSVRRGHAGPPLPTPGAQCKRKMCFDLSIIPFDGDSLSFEAIKLAEGFLNPPFVVELPSPVKAAEKSFSLLELEPSGSVLVSCFKASEDGKGYVVRLFNVTAEACTAKLKLGFAPSKAYVVSLDEERVLDEVEVSGRLLCVEVPPFKVVTLKLEVGAC